MATSDRTSTKFGIIPPALSNGIVQGQGFAVNAIALPEQAGVLSATMQQCARRALAADRKGGEALLEKAAALAEARQAAAPGEWGTFLEAINVHERAAQRLIAIHERATNDAAFREGVQRGWLSFSVAALVAHAEASLLEQLLLQEEPPTRSQIETLLAKPDTGVGSPEPEREQQIIDQPASPPPLPAHLAAAGYRWHWITPTVAVINGMGGWQGNAPTVAGALSLAEDRYAARMPTPQAQPAADAADAIASDIVAAARALGLIARLDGVDLWLYWPSEADSLAQDGDDGGGSRISPWLWPQQAEEVRAWLRDDAPGLAETRQAAPAPAPADWRHDPALVQSMARFNDAVRGNDRAAALRAVRAVVAALEAMED